MLDSVERDWNAFAAGRTVAAPAETFEAAIANGLRMHLRRYPHANFHAGFLLGGQSKVDPAEVEPLARAAAATCRLVLTDFPATVRAAIGATLAWAGITPTPDSLPEVEAPPLARTLRQWRERLTRPVFNRLCRLNEA
ncbi:hypothetical protein LVR64_29200, partial [Pseudomonas aeruginosa]|uniref:hypothetical protein n=1 Tax=Pseudomonas aeruginosa TaxID=287 RepID=UPI0020952713